MYQSDFALDLYHIYAQELRAEAAQSRLAASIRRHNRASSSARPRWRRRP